MVIFVEKDGEKRKVFNIEILSTCLLTKINTTFNQLLLKSNLSEIHYFVVTLHSD